MVHIATKPLLVLKRAPQGERFFAQLHPVIIAGCGASLTPWTMIRSEEPDTHRPAFWCVPEIFKADRLGQPSYRHYLVCTFYPLRSIQVSGSDEPPSSSYERAVSCGSVQNRRTTDP